MTETSRARERTSRAREAVLSLHPSFRIVTIRTPDAELEWALSPEQRDWALARVNGASTA